MPLSSIVDTKKQSGSSRHVNILKIGRKAPSQRLETGGARPSRWPSFKECEPKSGILRKWADKYGINIKVQRFDYAPSLDAFVSKNIDACVMTNMEALDMPAAAGIDTTAIIVGDYSNGNDAVLARHDVSLAQVPGKEVMLVEKTVSQYLFERAMAINGLGAQLKKVRYLNTSDSDIAAAFITDSSKEIARGSSPM